MIDTEGRPGKGWGAALTALIFVALAFAVYGSGLGIDYYSDDFQFLFAEPRRWLFAHFVEPNPLNDFYRPVQMSLMAAIQLVWGHNPTPLHALHIALHGLLATGVALTLMRLGLPRGAAAAGGLFVVISQVGVHPVLSNDTLAQITGTVFGFISLTLLDRYLSGAGRWPTVALSLAALAVSLWSKETSVGFCLLIAGLVIARRYRGGGMRDVKAIIAIGLPFFLVALAYVAARSSIVISHAALGEARYQFALGVNIPKNIVMLVGAALMPTATSTTFVAAKTQAYGLVAASLASTALFAALLGAGLYQSPRRNTALAVLLATLGATFPAAALNHVSEAYSYNLLPFIGLAVGLAAEAWMAQAPARRTAALVAAVGLGLVNVHAVQVKAAQMHTCGERAQSLLDQLATWAAEAPPNATLLLISPKPDIPPYSIFLINAYEHLHFADEQLRLRSGRPDLKLQRTREDRWQNAPCPSPCVPFGFEHNAVIPLGESELQKLGG